MEMKVQVKHTLHEWFRLKTRFETETKGNLGIAYCTDGAS